MIIPHGGGAVPYHWGRYRGLAQDLKRPPLEELLKNVYFDTCVYHLPGIELLFKVVPLDNILFGSEMVGAVRGIDVRTGQYYDDTKRYVDALALSEADRHRVYSANARRVFPRLDALLKKKAAELSRSARMLPARGAPAGGADAADSQRPPQTDCGTSTSPRISARAVRRMPERPTAKFSPVPVTSSVTVNSPLGCSTDITRCEPCGILAMPVRSPNRHRQDPARLAARDVGRAPERRIHGHA